MTAAECEITLTRERSAVRLCLPADVSATLGTGRLLPAIVTINGHHVHTTLHKMGGGYMMAVNADLRRELGVDAGDTVHVSVAPHDAPPAIEVPDDLAAALDAAGRRPAFEALTAFRRAETVKSVLGAKRPETRGRRIAQAVEDLGADGGSVRSSAGHPPAHMACDPPMAASRPSRIDARVAKSVTPLSWL